MGARKIIRCSGFAVLLAWVLNATVTIPAVSAQESCPDVEVIFARGTDEPPGIGGVGKAFVDSLRSHVIGRSLGVYAVDYPASDDFSKATDGANDAGARVRFMAANCPTTKLVLGGFSQGAGVIDLMTVPQSSFADYIVAPLPPSAARHVAAVVVFGNPGAKLMGGPLTAVSPVYGLKAIDVCIEGDPVCSDGGNILLHGLYVQSGKAAEAATFAASRL